MAVFVGQAKVEDQQIAADAKTLADTSLADSLVERVIASLTDRRD